MNTQQLIFTRQQANVTQKFFIEQEWYQLNDDKKRLCSGSRNFKVC
jgi:hypothetical protein